MIERNEVSCSSSFEEQQNSLHGTHGIIGSSAAPAVAVQ
jgi:hypothetical protein